VVVEPVVGHDEMCGGGRGGTSAGVGVDLVIGGWCTGVLRTLQG
jgi:hypothetical protein